MLNMDPKKELLWGLWVGFRNLLSTCCCCLALLGSVTFGCLLRVLISAQTEIQERWSRGRSSANDDAACADVLCHQSLRIGI